MPGYKIIVSPPAQSDMIEIGSYITKKQVSVYRVLYRRRDWSCLILS